MKFTSAKRSSGSRFAPGRAVTSAARSARRELAKVEPSRRSRSRRTRSRRSRRSDRSMRASRPRKARRSGSISTGFPISPSPIQKLHIEGAALEPREIFDLIAFLDRAADAGSFLNAAAERFPLLGERARGIGDFRPLAQRNRRQDSGRWNRARYRQPASAPPAPRNRETEERHSGFAGALPPRQPQ